MVAAVCRTGADCSAGEKCASNKCVVPCVTHSQCQTEQTCVNGACILGCRSNKNCPPTESCINNKCQGIEEENWEEIRNFLKSMSIVVPDPCKRKDVCGPNAICSITDHATSCTCPLGFHGNPTPQQGCVRVPNICEGPQDCPSQHLCVSGFCQCQCSEPNNCAEGERCKNGICMKLCYSDSNCLPGELCIDGVCEVGCTSDVGCNDNEVCINNKCKYVETRFSLSK